MVFPGLVFFQDDGKGKGKGKKGDGKGFDKGFDGKGFAPQYAPPAPQNTWATPPAKAAQRGTMALKLLLPANEASCVLGKGGATIREIGQNTFTKLSLSGMSEFFPGTNLQELRIRGSSTETVLAAIMLVFTQISQSLGVISGGDTDVPAGEARVKVIIPAAAAKIVIGRAGTNIKELRAQSGMFVHIEEIMIPPGPPTDLSEQVICLSGKLDGLQAAMPLIAGHVGEVANEPWFATWCMSSNAGTFIPGLQLFQNVKGHGKGKGKADAHGMGGGAYDNGGKGSYDTGKGLYGPAAVPSFAGGKGHAPYASPPMNKARGLNVSLKLLFTADEANCIYGADGRAFTELQATTYTTMRMSDAVYPGSDLYELVISGANEEGVLAAVLQVLDRIMEYVGSVTAGEGGVESGGAALKLVIPAKAAAAVIGVGGQTVKQLRQQSGVRLSVDTNPVPCTAEMAEQAVLIMGTFSAVNLALSTVMQQVAEVSAERWFEIWATSSIAGTHIPGFQLFAKGKGKGAEGKSKDGKSKGFGKDSGFGKGDGYFRPGKGYDKGYGPGAGGWGPGKGYDNGFGAGFGYGY
jgi:ribosomal protein S3